ncbi:MAG TPA: Crp/Fnr family transcriptional regulator, partial [Saprospiraceae bacterium]|nr:Crp/Fnr family transcriptional regulator [Saprospiraceae bacterium]
MSYIYHEENDLSMQCSCDNCHIKMIFYESLMSNDLEGFCGNRTEIILPKGYTFIKQGDEIKNFKYLKEGLIKLHKVGESGKTQIISFGKPMDFVSIHNIFAEKTYSYSVTTL